MKELLAAVHDLLTGLNLPVYAAGTVPADAPLPRLVWSAELAGDTLTVTAEIWHTGAAEISADWTERISAIVPEPGVRLPDGMGLLRTEGFTLLRSGGLSGVRWTAKGVIL